MKTLLLLLLSLPCMSQDYGSYWYLSGPEVDFGSGNPINITPTSMPSSQESIATVGNPPYIMHNSDNVFDRTNALMFNGQIAGNISTSQGMILRIKDSLYRAFYIDQYSTAGNFYWADIDTSLQGGNGEVITKDNLIGSGYTEKMTAIQRNCNSYWLVVQTRAWVYEVYLVDSTGHSLYSTHQGYTPTGTIYGIGCLKFSEDGTKIASTYYEGNVEECDFTNGVISNCNVTTGINNAYGVCYDGNTLYVGERAFNGAIHDITNGVVMGNVGVSQQVGQMEVHNGVVWGTVYNSNRLFSIDNGVLNLNAHTLSTNQNGLGVPQRVYPNCAIILPIKNTNIRATYAKGIVTAYINTDILPNTQYLELQFTRDGHNFESIYEVWGIPQHFASFTFWHEYVGELGYLRLCAVDFDGGRDYSNLFKIDGEYRLGTIYFNVLGQQVDSGWYIDR